MFLLKRDFYGSYIHGSSGSNLFKLEMQNSKIVGCSSDYLRKYTVTQGYLVSVMVVHILEILSTTQLTFTCSKSTIVALKKCEIS